ncbi:MAG TPA: hypothetical protein VF278_20565 [Pirellulales bacterium]
MHDWTHFAVGDDIPEMPLFVGAGRYINVPLEATYSAAFVGVPDVWKAALG